MGIIEDVFHIEGKKCNDQEILKICRRFMPELGEIKSSRKKFSGREGRAKERMRLFRACSLAELGKVACGSAMQDFWLGDRKVESHVIGNDRDRLSERGTVGEVRSEE